MAGGNGRSYVDRRCPGPDWECNHSSLYSSRHCPPLATSSDIPTSRHPQCSIPPVFNSPSVQFRKRNRIPLARNDGHIVVERVYWAERWHQGRFRFCCLPNRDNPELSYRSSALYIASGSPCSPPLQSGSEHGNQDVELLNDTSTNPQTTLQPCIQVTLPFR